MLPHLEDLIRGIVLAYTALIPGGDHDHDDCDVVLAYAALIPALDNNDEGHQGDYFDGSDKYACFVPY